MRMVPSICVLLPVLLMSCGREGCRDVRALNFDMEADRDGPCRYTKAIFYAGSNRIGGTATRVTKIEVSRLIVSDAELIGTISDLAEENPGPQGCVAPANAVEVELGTGLETRFTTRYFYEDGTDEAGDTYILSPERLTECIVENLTL